MEPQRYKGTIHFDETLNDSIQFPLNCRALLTTKEAALQTFIHFGNTINVSKNAYMLNEEACGDSSKEKLHERTIKHLEKPDPEVIIIWVTADNSLL